jgi:hypothetical protein
MKNKWWEAAKGEAHAPLFELIETIKIKQAGKSEENLRHLRLYGNSDVLGLRLGEFSRAKSLNKITLNVIQMAVDTATARLAKNKPKPMFVTSDGDFSIKRQAKLLEQYTMGQFQALKLYRKGPQVLRDSFVFGDGWLYWYFKDGKINCERVFVEEILVDEDEAVYGEARRFNRLKYVSKDSLKEKFPKFAMEIDAASTEQNSYLFDSLENNMVTVAESWSLGTDGKKGRHVLAIKTATLADEAWEFEHLPFTRISCIGRLLGFYAQGFAEVLTGLQVEINRLLKSIQLSMHLGSVPKIMVENSSKVVSSHLNNDIGTIIKYTGTPPQSVSLMNVPPELFIQLDKLYQRAFEQVGISQLSATSQKPAGLNSGKALREFHDLETERFALHAQAYEDFYMDCAKMIVDMTKYYAKKENFKVTVVDKRQMKVIEWKDVNIKEDQYVLKVYPTNLLSDTPAGRLSDIQDLIEMGLIDQVQAKALLDYPDIEASMSLDNAKYEDIQAAIAQIVDKGEYQPPEQFQDLNYGLQMMQYAYLKYKRMNLEEDRLDLFRRWIEDATFILMPPEAEVNEADLDLEEEALLEQELGAMDETEVQGMEDEMPLPEDLIL